MGERIPHSLMHLSNRWPLSMRPGGWLGTMLEPSSPHLVCTHNLIYVFACSRSHYATHVLSCCHAVPCWHCSVSRPLRPRWRSCPIVLPCPVRLPMCYRVSCSVHVLHAVLIFTASCRVHRRPEQSVIPSVGCPRPSCSSY